MWLGSGSLHAGHWAELSGQTGKCLEDSSTAGGCTKPDLPGRLRNLAGQ